MAYSNSKKNNLPQNVGIIMDGNGRWAIKNALKIAEGHKKGVNAVSYTHLTLPTNREV